MTNNEGCSPSDPQVSFFYYKKKKKVTNCKLCVHSNTTLTVTEKDIIGEEK